MPQIQPSTPAHLPAGYTRIRAWITRRGGCRPAFALRCFVARRAAIAGTELAAAPVRAALQGQRSGFCAECETAVGIRPGEGSDRQLGNRATSKRASGPRSAVRRIVAPASQLRGSHGRVRQRDHDRPAVQDAAGHQCHRLCPADLRQRGQRLGPLRAHQCRDQQEVLHPADTSRVRALFTGRTHHTIAFSMVLEAHVRHGHPGGRFRYGG